jgi:hypothetical protein
VIDMSNMPKEAPMIRKLPSGQYRLYSRKVNPKTGKRRNLGTFKSRVTAEKHERKVQYFKRVGTRALLASWNRVAIQKPAAWPPRSRQ